MHLIQALFLSKQRGAPQTNGFAILVEQPWNKEREEFIFYIKKGRLYLVDLLYELPKVVKSIEDKINIEANHK